MTKPLKTYTSVLESIPDSEDLICKIPDEILESEDWRVGDKLDLEVKGQSLVITNLSKLERETQVQKGAPG